MNAKERTQKAVNLDNPDRVPLRCCINRITWAHRSEQYLKDLIEYLNNLPLDTPPLTYMKKEDAVKKEKTWTDEWACLWEEKIPGEFGTVIKSPLEDWSNFASYTFPDIMPKYKTRPKDSGYYTIAEGADRYGVLWYQVQFLRTYENIMMDLGLDIPRACLLRDKVLEKRIAYLKKAIELNPHAEAIYFGDCWGVQDALMISPAQWRDIFKPAYKQLFDIVHEADKKVFFQSDGYTFDIIDDLIDIGANVLKISVGMMDIPALAKKFKGKACLWADPCRQHIMPKGTTQDVKKHIKQLIDNFRIQNNGGLIGDLYIDQDIPLDNIKAAYDTYLEYSNK